MTINFNILCLLVLLTSNDRCIITLNNLRIIQEDTSKTVLLGNNNFPARRIDSLVYDLTKERGTVSSRVALLLRSVEVQPFVSKNRT